MKQKIKLYQQGKGQSLSLIHGWGMNAGVFEPLAELLSEEFMVTRVDLPGYGRSGWLEGADFDGQVDALAEVLPSSTVVGWSLGGLYALQLVNRYPQKFNKLLLLSCNPCFVQRDDWTTAVETDVFTEFSDSLMENWRLTVRRFLGLQMHGVEGGRQLIRQISDLLIKGGEPDSQAMQFGLDLLLKLDSRKALKELQAPIMEILGQRDTLVPVSVASGLRLINPSIRVECLARSAHAPFLSHPEKVSGLISEFAKSPTT